MRLLFISYVALLADANVYLHSPRGSNNRLNEKSAENENNERLFQSNNNRRGGYNVGDKTDDDFSDEAGQYAMQYFQSGNDGKSYLTVEWTSLLGCGEDEDGDKIHNCEVVLQTNCQGDDFDGVPPSDSYSLRNGEDTDQMPYEMDPYNPVDPAGRCFIDSSNRDLKHKQSDIPDNVENSIDYCRAKCGEKGYSYAGIQYTDECRCDDEFGKYGEAPIEACDRDCNDDSGNKCGGSWRQNIYLALNDVSSKTFEGTTIIKETKDDDFETVAFDDYESKNDDHKQDDYKQDDDYMNGEDNDNNNESESSNSMAQQDRDETTQVSSSSEKDCGGGGFRNIASRLFSRGERSSSRRIQENGTESQNEKNSRRSDSEDKDIGLHESWEFYDRCEPSIETRYGMECKEEREQWPEPETSISPWVDVAYFTDDESNICTSDIEELNHRQFNECVEYYDESQTSRKHKSNYKTRVECEANGGDWFVFYKVGDILDEIQTESECTDLNDDSLIKHVWGRPMSWKDLAEDILSDETCIALPAKTQCLPTPNTRGGYLGNVDNEHHTPRFHWTLPKYEEDKRCVFRIRYIVSVNDDDINKNNEIFYMENNDGLALAHTKNHNIFEDRSHIFKLLQRPDEIQDDLDIHNIVVRGKRGNIVQTYPAVEYDFVPNRLTILYGEAIHVQWTGSNTHDNNGPGGDGQTGDAGEGRGGSDRNNFIQLMDRTANLVAPDHNQTLFQDAEWIWSSHDMGNPSNKAFNLALSMATSGYYQCETEDECNAYYNANLQDQLNNAPASYQGNLFMPAIGEYHYKSMRNDNFSNRGQKGTITVLS